MKNKNGFATITIISLMLGLIVFLVGIFVNKTNTLNSALKSTTNQTRMATGSVLLKKVDDATNIKNTSNDIDVELKKLDSEGKALDTSLNDVQIDVMSE